MGANLELFAAFLVDVGATEDGEAVDGGGEGDGACDLGTGAFGSGDDLGDGGVEEFVVVCFELDANLVAHGDFLFLWRSRAGARGLGGKNG